MSEPKSFMRDVLVLFFKYANDMQNQAPPITAPNGAGLKILYLNDYASVKQFHYAIQVAIHGYDRDSDGKWRVPPAQRLRKQGGGAEDWVASAPHPMPPDGRMPQQAIDIFDQWVRDGMLP